MNSETLLAAALASILGALIGVVIVPLVIVAACIWGLGCGISWIVQNFKEAMEKS